MHNVVYVTLEGSVENVKGSIQILKGSVGNGKGSKMRENVNSVNAWDLE